MMLDVDGSKLNGRRCYCHGAKDKQDHLHDRMGPEAAMGQHAMVTNGQAEGSERVHRCQKCQIGPLNGALPKRSSCQEHEAYEEPGNYLLWFRKSISSVYSSRGSATVTDLYCSTYRTDYPHRFTFS